MGISVVYGLYTLLLAERLYLTQDGKNSIILKLASVAQPVEQLIRNQQVACSSHVTSSKPTPFRCGLFVCSNTGNRSFPGVFPSKEPRTV